MHAVRAWPRSGPWVAVVSALVACGAPDDPSDASVRDAGSSDAPADLPLDAFDPGRLRLLRMEPSRLRLRGGVMVELFFEGEPPERFTVEDLNLAIALHGGDGFPPSGPSPWSLFFGARVDGPRSIDLVVLDDRRVPVARLDHAGEYYAEPATPTLHPTLDERPLAPELSRPCARRGVIAIRNEGDVPFTITSSSVDGDDAFTIAADRSCDGSRVLYDQCEIHYCFTSAEPGAHRATLRAHTDAGEATATLEATVLPRSVGLDTGFGTAGALHVSGATRAAALVGDGVAVGGRSGIDTVHRDGTVVHFAGFTDPSTGFVHSFPTDLATSPSGEAVYAILWTGPSTAPAMLVRVSEDELDRSFGASGTVNVTLGAIFAGDRLSVGEGGTIVVRGTSGIAAFAPNGDAITSFGMAGALELGVVGGIAAARDAVYVAYDEPPTFEGPWQIRRFSMTDGTVDPAFVHPERGTPSIGRDGWLYVNTGGAIERVDPLGAATRLPLAYPTPPVGLSDLALDELGRVWVVESGRAWRFHADGTFDGVIGLGGALRVLCPERGGCWIVGGTELESWVALALP